MIYFETAYPTTIPRHVENSRLTGISKQFAYKGWRVTHGYIVLGTVCSRVLNIPNIIIAITASIGVEINIYLGTYPLSSFLFTMNDNSPLITKDGPSGVAERGIPAPLRYIGFSILCIANPAN